MSRIETQLDICVQKFGGTSVGSPERIKNVARRVIESQKKGNRAMVVVVSAMGDTTDHLIELSRSISSKPDAREYDALISTGENVSAALLSMALIDMGHKAISLTGPQAGIKTENIYSKAKIIQVDNDRLLSELKEGKIVVVTGFQGLNEAQDVTTIGRGGSDTSAVVLAAALGASVCEIYTDVDGVYTTDPRKVKDARKLPEISYDEMLELASLGAKVLHPRSVECAKENKIILHVRSSLEPQEGTYVKEDQDMEVNRPVTGVTVNEEEAMITLCNVSDEPGVAGKLFGALADAAINVDMIIQSSELDQNNDISFTVSADDLQQAQDVTKAVSQTIPNSAVSWKTDIAKLSIVGVGMISKPGIAATLFKTLGQNGINIKMISTSEIKISCVIDQKEAQRALQLVHDAFQLGR